MCLFARAPCCARTVKERALRVRPPTLESLIPSRTLVMKFTTSLDMCHARAPRVSSSSHRGRGRACGGGCVASRPASLTTWPAWRRCGKQSERNREGERVCVMVLDGGQSKFPAGEPGYICRYRVCNLCWPEPHFHHPSEIRQNTEHASPYSLRRI